MNPKLEDEPFMAELRKKHPKQGPDPKPGEPIDKWAERYIQYVRIKHGIEENK